MEELSLRQIQLHEYDILKQLKKICDEQNISYYLFYGTLLGAVRHKGFIPWDDDIDIAMLRDDYERFIKYCKENSDKITPLVLMNYSTNKNYPFCVARLCDTRFQVDYDDTVDYGLGLFVDIYPVDGCGSGDLDAAKEYMHQNDLLLDLVSIAAHDRFRKSKDGKFSTTIKKFGAYSLSKLIGSQKLIKITDNKAKRYSTEDSDYYGMVCWHMGSEVICYPRSCFDKKQQFLFEDEYFDVPFEYDKVLELNYGDYMKLPPESEQTAHHNYKAYLKSDL